MYNYSKKLKPLTRNSGASTNMDKKQFNYLNEHDIVEMEEVLEEYNMKKRHLEAQKMHNHPINYTVKSVGLPTLTILQCRKASVKSAKALKKNCTKLLLSTISMAK